MINDVSLGLALHDLVAARQPRAAGIMIDEDLARAKEILARGKAGRDAQLHDIFPQPDVRERVQATGGTIANGDGPATYQILTRLVALIELHQIERAAFIRVADHL